MLETIFNYWLVSLLFKYWFVPLFIIVFLYGYLKEKLKNLRYSKKKEYKKCESPIEEMLFNALISRGYKVYTQAPCGNYRIDLAVYSGRKKLAIECDGAAFHTSTEQVAHDQKKDKFLKKNKWKVVRFTGSEIYNNREWCVDTIQNIIKPT